MALGSIVDYLKRTGKNSSYSSRKDLAKEYGIEGYSGTAQQNTQLLQYLQEGRPTNGGAGNTGTPSSGAGNAGQSGSSTPSPYLSGYNYQKYTPSESVNKYKNILTDMEGNKPEAYESQYKGQIDDILDTILNRPQFDENSVYDSDLYKNYKENYIQQGQRAMRDTTGNAAGLTGGYGSTYAAAAGQQAYDNYLSQLNDKSMDIYDRLYDKYLNEGTELYNQLGTLNNQDNIEYGRYRDDVSDYQWGLGYYDNRYNQEYANDYGAYQNDLAAQQWAEQYAYQKQQDILAQQNWESEFAYQKQQDAIANALAQQKAAAKGSSTTKKTEKKEPYSNGLPPYSQNYIDKVRREVYNLKTNKEKFDYVYDLAQSDGELEEWCRLLGITPTTKQDPKPLPRVGMLKSFKI